MPITPVHVPMGDELLYSAVDFLPSSGFTPDLGSLSHLSSGSEGWFGQDMDVTPTLGFNDHEKSLAALERELVNDV
jgi:hypothetical protein